MSWFDRLFRRKQLRREAWLGQPFPEEWLRIAERCVSSYPALNEGQQRLLRESIQILVAEKEFVGVGGLTVTEEIKVAIAAQACLLIIGAPGFDVYPRLREVIIYPYDFGKVVEAVAPDGRRYRIEELHAGEAWHRGPVVLAWNDVSHSIAHPCDGYNVVYHEFAHVLDMQYGVTQGGPPLEGRGQREEWTRVFDAEFRSFLEETRRGRRTFLDPYGASNPEEFFAVATEHFFEQPREMKARHGDLYAQFVLLYRQDPAKWWLEGPWTSRSGHWG